MTVKLDRLARSIRDLLRLQDEIKATGAKFKALDDPWCDTTTPQGERAAPEAEGTCYHGCALLRFQGGIVDILYIDEYRDAFFQERFE